MGFNSAFKGLMTMRSYTIELVCGLKQA